jgi:excisionase family DNA binding protein
VSTANAAASLDLVCPDLLTPLEAARYLRIGRTKVYGMLRTGELPSIRVGRLYRIKKPELEAWSTRRRTARDP